MVLKDLWFSEFAGFTEMVHHFSLCLCVLVAKNILWLISH